MALPIPKPGFCLCSCNYTLDYILLEACKCVLIISYVYPNGDLGLTMKETSCEIAKTRMVILSMCWHSGIFQSGMPRE